MSLEFYMADLDKIPAIQKEAISSTKWPTNRCMQPDKVPARIHIAADAKRYVFLRRSVTCKTVGIRLDYARYHRRI